MCVFLYYINLIIQLYRLGFTKSAHGNNYYTFGYNCIGTEKWLFDCQQENYTSYCAANAESTIAVKCGETRMSQFNVSCIIHYNYY